MKNPKNFKFLTFFSQDSNQFSRWIIGSAFRLPEQGGYGLLASASAAGQKKTGSFPPEMVSLATKAGMNSEVRRHIFCSVGTSVKIWKNDEK